MRQIYKRMLRVLSELTAPRVDKARYAEFFAHPCFLALRQEAARRLDAAADVVYQSDNIDEINRARGAMAGLMFVLDSETNLAHIIAAAEQTTTKDVEQRINEVLTLMESEHGRGKY